MRELAIGDPARLAIDVGPVIDAEARAGIERAHRRRCAPAAGASCSRPATRRRRTAHGTFVPPTLIEIDRLAELEREVFGPVLHVLRYRRDDLGALIGADQRHRLRPDARHAHPHRRDRWRRSSAPRMPATSTSTATWSARWSACSRSAAKACPAPARRPAGRSTCCACSRARPDERRARGPRSGAGARRRRGCRRRRARPGARARCSAGPAQAGAPAAGRGVRALRRRRAAVGRGASLPGPTGEAQRLRLVPRDAVLCLADDDARPAGAARRGAGRRQPRAVAEPRRGPAWQRCPSEARDGSRWSHDWAAPAARFDAVLHHGDATSCARCCAALARAAGPIVGVDRARGRRHRDAAGAAGGRARAQHQHRRRRRQREPDDDRLSFLPLPLAGEGRGEGQPRSWTRIAAARSSSAVPTDLNTVRSSRRLPARAPRRGTARRACRAPRRPRTRRAPSGRAGRRSSAAPRRCRRTGAAPAKQASSASRIAGVKLPIRSRWLPGRSQCAAGSAARWRAWRS